MALRATTVRFSEDLWELLERESRRSGVSAAQFVRDATLFRLATLAAREDHPSAEDSRPRLAAMLSGAPAPAAVEAAVCDAARLRVLRSTELLDSGPEERFERFTRLVRRMLEVPVALVSLVEDHRQYFKSGAEQLSEPFASRRETPLSHSFCQHVVADGAPMLIRDARRHPILRTNRAIADLGVVAYLGAPLIVEGQSLGSLCAIDDKPRDWTGDELDTLRDLAAALSEEIAAQNVPRSPL